MAKKQVEKFQLTEKQEQYLLIYHEYFVLKWSWDEICKFHDCSKTKVTTAVKWVIANRLEFPSKNLIKGAIDAIKIRMKRNNEMYEKETSKKRYRDNAFIIALSREIREDEKTLYKLEEVYNDGQDDAALSAGQVLKLIKTASETNN